MNEEKVREFDQFFIKNYKYLLGFCKSIEPKHDYESTLHDCFIRARTRIEQNGYSGSTYLNYFRCTAMNFYKSQYRNEKSRQLIDINDEDYYATVEDILLQKESQLQQEIDMENTNTFLTSMIYEYIDRYYSQKEQFVFRTYYLLKHKHLNYKMLSEATGYSITSVSNIIKKMKKDLRTNLKSYIQYGERITEPTGSTIENQYQ